MKAATRRKLFYTGIGIVLAAVVAVVIVPPMLDFDRLKPQIESAILNQTGIDIDISGRVRLSLLGRATITAYDIKMREYGNGVIDSVSFHVPLGYIFNIYAAPLSDTIILRGAKLHLTTLAAPSNISSRVEFRDSAVTFLGKTYKNIDGVFQNGLFDGTVRTNDHKYTLSTDGDTFQITNPNVNLNLTGQLATNDLGEIAASGEISIDSDNVNKWFEFDVPKI
ncbi:MAG: hypothetical protein FWG18_03620, partial [Alphaproteobacteria bacterium]|nr:hypothetical protein [Alphaproteobacteria bacterium]